jgi:serine/threonine protein kinase
VNDLCSIDLLKSALAGTLSSNEEASLARHLDECESCGAAMEGLAAEPAFFQEAASLLTADVLDEAVPLRDEWSQVDFGVEYLEPEDDASYLGRLGGYGIEKIIGRGGMGVVLRGFDLELKRHVAIKVLAPQLAHSPLARRRFTREAQAAAAVVHPNVLAIHQVQPTGRLPFIVMPLVAGESLAERLTARGLLELKEVLRIGMQAAAGLAAAHDQGLVHRDVKPANIMLEHGIERALLTDFGLARAGDDVTMTRSGIIAGTPQYMSPEQAHGESLDGRSDLFSLGCVLYEMATGVSPFKADSPMATLRRLVDEPPRPMTALNPELPQWFVGIVNRLLEKDPSRRFRSAREVSELLERCLAHVQQPSLFAVPDAALALDAEPRSALGDRRKTVVAWLAVAGLFVLAAGAAALFRSHGSAAPQPEPEEATQDSTAEPPSPNPPTKIWNKNPNPRVIQFAVLDRNRDGKLTFAEFCSGRGVEDGRKWFYLRDANQDGVVSFQEYFPDMPLPGGETVPEQAPDGYPRAD